MQKKRNRRGGKRQRAFSVFAASILIISSLGSGLAGMTVSAEGTESVTKGFEDGDFTDGGLTIDNGTVENVDGGEVTSYDAENSDKDGTVNDSTDDPKNLIDDSGSVDEGASAGDNASGDEGTSSEDSTSTAENTTEEPSEEREAAETITSLAADITHNGDTIGKVEINFDDPISADTTLSVETLADEKLYNRALTEVLENGGTDIEDVDILQFSFGSSDGGMGVCPNDGATVTIKYDEDIEISDQTARVMEFGEDPGLISDTKIKTSDRNGHTYIDSYSFKYNFEKNGSDDGENTMSTIATFLSADRRADDGKYYVIREGSDGAYYAMKDDGSAVKVNLSDGQITVTDEAADTSLVTGNAYSSLVVGDVAYSSFVSDDTDEDGKIATDSDIAKNSKTIIEGGSRGVLIWTKSGDRLYSSDYAQINVSPETVGTAAVSTSHTANVIVSEPDENGMSSIYSVDFAGDGLDRSAEYYALTLDEAQGIFTTTELDTVPENHTILVPVNDADDSDGSTDEDKKTADSAEAESDLAESALEESAAPDIPAAAKQINRAPARVPASSGVTVTSVTAKLQGGASSGTGHYNWDGVTTVTFKVEANITIASNIDANSLYFAVPASLFKDTSGTALDTLTFNDIRFNYTSGEGNSYSRMDMSSTGNGSLISDASRSVVYNSVALETSASTTWTVTFEAAYTLQSGKADEVSYFTPFDAQVGLKDDSGSFSRLSTSDSINIVRSDSIPSNFEISSRQGVTYLSTGTYQYSIMPDQTQNADKIQLSVLCGYINRKTFKAGELQLKVPAHLLKKSDGTALDTLALAGDLASSFGTAEVKGDNAVFTNTTGITINSSTAFQFVYKPEETLPDDTTGGDFQCTLMSGGTEITKTDTNTIVAVYDTSKLGEVTAIDLLNVELVSGAHQRSDGTYAWKKEEGQPIKLKVSVSLTNPAKFPAEDLNFSVPKNLFKLSNGSTADTVTCSLTSVKDKDGNNISSKFSTRNGSYSDFQVYNNTVLDPGKVTAEFEVTYTPNESDVKNIASFNLFDCDVRMPNTGYTTPVTVASSNAITVSLYQGDPVNQTFNVSTAEELLSAITYINEHEAANYQINFLADITLNTEKGIVPTRGNIFINGNEHTLTNQYYKQSSDVTDFSNSIISVEGAANVALSNITVLGSVSAGPILNVYGSHAALTIDNTVTVKNGQTGANMSGVEVTNGGTFTMNGGLIEDCRSDDFVGGVFADSGTFNMNGGSILNCLALGDYAISGGVFLQNNATFNMTAGTVSGCIASGAHTFTGGIAASGGTVTMSGGAITGCSGRYSGGLLLADGCTATLSGGEISGNTSGEGGGGLYALTEDNLPVTVNASGCRIYNNTASSQAADVQVDGGSTITLMTGDDLKALNQQFHDSGINIDGWYKDASGSRWATSDKVVGYKSGTVTANNDGIYLIAAYSGYTLKYDLNGGERQEGDPEDTYADVTAHSGAKVTAAKAPRRAGYNFKGWNTVKEGNGTAYAAGATFALNANTTLYAQWEAGVALPNTGGSGTTIFYLIGLLLTITAGVGIICKKRKTT